MDLINQVNENHSVVFVSFFTVERKGKGTKTEGRGGKDRIFGYR